MFRAWVIRWPGLHVHTLTSCFEILAMFLICIHLIIYLTEIQEEKKHNRSTLQKDPTDQACCRETSLKKCNSIICTDTSCNPLLSAFKNVYHLFLCLGTSGEVRSAMASFIVLSMINLNLLPFDHHLTAFAFIWSLRKVDRPFGVLFESSHYIVFHLCDFFCRSVSFIAASCTT